jgi:VRR-NUC domain-containing protein
MTTTLPLTISEAQLQRTVIDYALLRGWRCVHYRPARTIHGYRTALTGHPGAPDLLLARDGRILCIELKRQHGRLTPDQRLWLAALGGNARCWRPADWPQILEELR